MRTPPHKYVINYIIILMTRPGTNERDKKRALPLNAGKARENRLFDVMDANFTSVCYPFLASA
jgi:hypothetical protein